MMKNPDRKMTTEADDGSFLRRLQTLFESDPLM